MGRCPRCFPQPLQLISHIKSQDVLANVGKISFTDDDVMLESLRRVLLQVRRVLSSMVRAWDQFAGLDGDKAFFSDVKNPDECLALHVIKEHFEKLRLLEAKMDAMDEYCKNRFESASLPS